MEEAIHHYICKLNNIRKKEVISWLYLKVF
jgi:hypothetical protein